VKQEHRRFTLPAERLAKAIHIGTTFFEGVAIALMEYSVRGSTIDDAVRHGARRRETEPRYKRPHKSI
jgi:hypothetical protein